MSKFKEEWVKAGLRLDGLKGTKKKCTAKKMKVLEAKVERLRIKYTLANNKKYLE